MLVYINGSLVQADAGSLRVSDAVGQRSTCNFTVRDDAATAVYQQGQPVVVLDDTNGNRPAFVGFIDNIVQMKGSYAATLSHQIQCADFHYLTDKRIAAASYVNQTADYIVNDLTKNYLAAEGVVGTTAAPVFTRSGTATLPDGSSDAASGAPRYLTSSNKNLLTANQSSFETDLSGMTTGVSGSHILTSGNNATMNRDTTTAWQGTASLHFNSGTFSSGFGGVEFSPGFAIPANTNVTISFYYKTPQNGGAIRLYDYGNNTSGPGGVSVAPTPAANWTRQTYTWFQTAATTNMGFAYRTATQNQDVWLDGVQVEYGSAATTWEVGGSIPPGTNHSVFIEEGTTNLFSANQSDVETDTTGFGSDNSATLTRDTTQHWHGTASLKVVTPGTVAFEGAVATVLSTSFSASTTYTASAWVKGTPGVVLSYSVKRNDTFASLASGTVTLVAGWQRVALTFTTPASGSMPDASHGFQLYVETNTTTATTFWLDGLQMEAKLYATSWTLGGSTRANETLNLPAAATIANPQEGTVDIWFYATSETNRQVTNSFTRLWNLGKPSTPYHGLILFHSPSSAQWTFETRTQDDTVSTGVTFSDSLTATNTWHLITCTWSASSNVIEVYVDGALAGSTSSPVLPTALHATLGAFIGYDGGTNFLGGAVGSFRISTRRRSASEIAAYADSALTLDGDTSYLLPVNNNLTQQTSIQPASTVNTATFDYLPVSDAMDQLADYAGYWWVITPGRLLCFMPRAQVNAPWVADGTTMDESTVQVQRNNPMYRNRQYIKGGMDVTASQTETRQGDGKATTFTMSYPLAQVPTITLNSVAQTVGIKGVDSGKNWYWAKGDAVVAQDSSGTKLVSTDTLSVTYVGQFPVVVLAYDQSGVTNRQGIEGGTTTGYVDAVESITNVTSSAQGFQIANARISRFSNLSGVTITFETLNPGLAPGQTLTVNLPSHNVNNVQTLIEAVTTHDDPAHMLTVYGVKCLVGPANTSYVQFWNAIFGKTQAASNQTSIGSANTTLAIQTAFTETWTWGANESVVETVYSCPVPNTTLFPNTTLYPC